MRAAAVLALTLALPAALALVADPAAPTFVVGARDEAALLGALARAGLAPLDALESVPAALVRADARALAVLARDARVTSIEANVPLEFDLSTSTTATRARPVWDEERAQTVGLHAILDDDGNPIDGRGVGIALVDTGVNGAHPDLPWKLKVARNFLAVPDPLSADPLAFVDVPDSTPTATHGHHVAGILAGLGNGLPQGAYKGAAPGATLTSFSAATADFWFAAKAWDWVFAHGAEQDPPIRVVSNSWGIANGPCDPEHALSKIQRRLVLERGVTMVFSAGNSGGDGSTDNTRSQFRCGYGGLIGVANYDDLNVASREGPLSATSSRGRASDPTSWPDVSAPGTNIYGPAALNQPPPTTTYTAMSGTSMAAPQVAGALALLTQAHDGLSPAQAECLVEETAYKFADSGAYASSADRRHDGSHFAKGHGLLDAHAAVRAALDLKHGALVGAAATCAGVDPLTEN